MVRYASAFRSTPTQAHSSGITNSASRSWTRPSVPSGPRNWPLRRLAGKVPSCRPAGNIDCRFEVRPTLRRVAPAQTPPRGERGPRLATDLQPRPVPQSTPAETEAGFGGVCVFKKQNTGISFRACPRSQTRRRHGALLRRGFPYGFSRGIPCSAYTGRYPIPASALPALRSVHRQRGM